MARILLIDDDELLRYTMLQLLQLDKHQTVEAVDAETGLQHFGDGRAFDLVITDMLMPGMDGARLIVELHRRCPHMPVLAISGGRRLLSPEFNLQSAGLVGAKVQLAKPFGRAELQLAVKCAMEEEPR